MQVLTVPCSGDGDPPPALFLHLQTAFARPCHGLLRHVRPYPAIYLSGYSKQKCMKTTGCQNATCRRNKRQSSRHLLSFRKPFLLSLPGLSHRHSSPGMLGPREGVSRRPRAAASPSLPPGASSGRAHHGADADAGRRGQRWRARVRLGLQSPEGLSCFGALRELVWSSGFG